MKGKINFLSTVRTDILLESSYDKNIVILKMKKKKKAFTIPFYFYKFKVLKNFTKILLSIDRKWVDKTL